MRVTRCRTKRPRGALLQLGSGLGLWMCRIGGRLRSPDASRGGVNLEIPLFYDLGPNPDNIGGPCLVGSLTGAVAS